MAKKQQNNNNSNNGNNNNNFFNNNPLLIFVIFSIVTIFAFKAIFPEEQMGSSNANIQAFGQSSNKTIAYSDLKKLISSGKIEYVGIGNTQIRAVSKGDSGQVITYTARRVIPDETLITSLEQNGIGYGGINEENILADILCGWVLPIASISSIKIIAGATFFACSNKSLTLLAPTPTNISINAEPETDKNSTSASPATAFAKRVFPVPGGPTSKTPFGICAPSLTYLSGDFKKSTTS